MIHIPTEMNNNNMNNSSIHLSISAQLATVVCNASIMALAGAMRYFKEFLHQIKKDQIKSDSAERGEEEREGKLKEENRQTERKKERKRENVNLG